jgi:anti-anti-sigma regulatory factor
MPFELLTAEVEWTLTLSGVVDVFDATALHAAVRDAPEAAPARVVAAMAAAERVDASITQLLLALRRALEAHGKTLTLAGVPAAITERWQAAGLGDELRGEAAGDA